MVRWIIQENIAENEVAALKTACENSNIEYELLYIIPFDVILPDFTIDDKINIYYGSISFINAVYKKYKPIGIFYNNNFSIENYLNKWGTYMLSSDAIITNFNDFSLIVYGLLDQMLMIRHFQVRYIHLIK